MMNILDYHKYIKTAANVVSSHIPIIELSLIIQDYCVPTSPNMVRSGICPNCHNKHRRQLSLLCGSCKSLCLFCGVLGLQEKTGACFGCITKHPNALLLMNGKEKDRLFIEWYCVEFPSKIHSEEMSRKHRMDAAATEKKRKEDEFLAKEDAKPKDQLIQELREKLYSANREINSLRLQVSMSVLRRPEPPFY